VTTDADKRAAAIHAAGLVQSGMRVGLGTGSTVAPMVVALGERGLDIRCVATSPATEQAAKDVGLRVEPFDAFDWLDIAIDGADQIAPDGWLVKGGGRAHTREKIVAASAERFVVIASSDKLVERLRPPVPLELLAYGAGATLRRLEYATVREGPPSPDGGVIADWTGPLDDPAELATYLSGVTGVLEHGLFPPWMVTDVVTARDGVVDHRALAGA